MSISHHQGDGMIKPSAGSATNSDLLNTVLKGQRVFFPEKHFTQSRIDILSTYILELGGTISSERTDCTIILVNPRAPKYKDELDNATFLAKSYPKMDHPALKPYHWIASSRLAQTPLAVSKLLSLTPIFFHPDPAIFHSPVLVWVSVNVHRNEEPDAHTAQKAVMSLIEAAGGLCVEKRAMAELLVVDKSTVFYKTVMSEKIKYKREWQRVVERDWVEECVKARKMAWPPKEKEERDPDSMEREDPIVKNSGPGRPTGKPRVDYTPEDDDFLCRYLAAHHPNGSWMSRKTYSTLVSVPNLEHITSRHTAQSWHEHFKKSAAVMEKRVRRYIHAGIDSKTLKTQDERRKGKDMERQAQQARAAQPAPAASVDRENGRLEGDQAGAQEGARLMQSASKTSEAVATSANVPFLPENPSKDEDLIKEKKSPGKPITNAQSEGARMTTLAIQHPETVVQQIEIAARPIEAGPSQSAVVSHGAERKRTNLVELASDDEGKTDLSPQGNALEPEQSAQPNKALEDIFGSTENRIPGAKQPTAIDHFPIIRAQSKSPKKVRIDLGPGIAPVSAPAERNQAAPAYSESIDLAISRAADSTRSRHVEELAKELSTPRRLSATARFSTPAVSSSRKHSLMGDKIQSSEKKRQRTSLASSDRRKLTRSTDLTDEETPDTVMASTIFPPRVQVTLDPALPAAPVPQPRPPAPIVTLEQWQANVAAGKSVAERQKEEYKKNMKVLCDTYSLTPVELVKAMDSLPRKKGAAGELYWADVSRGLEEKFGR